MHRLSLLNLRVTKILNVFDYVLDVCSAADLNSWVVCEVLVKR